MRIAWMLLIGAVFIGGLAFWIERQPKTLLAFCIFKDADRSYMMQWQRSRYPVSWPYYGGQMTLFEIVNSKLVQRAHVNEYEQDSLGCPDISILKAKLGLTNAKAGR